LRRPNRYFRPIDSEEREEFGASDLGSKLALDEMIHSITKIARPTLKRQSLSDFTQNSMEYLKIRFLSVPLARTTVLWLLKLRAYHSQILPTLFLTPLP
jgi:hypothetical protein